MTGHALFSPSKAHMWIECPGSFAFPANTTDDGKSSTFADDGTASHAWAAVCLQSGEDAEYFIDTQVTLNGVVYKMDEERAGFVQVYLDLVRQHAIVRELFIEHRIDLSEWLGPDQGGTLDAGVIGEDIVDVIDLKYGTGEKVFASYESPMGTRLPNHQLGLYAAGIIRDAQMLGKTIKKARLIVCQPRLHHIDEKEFTAAEIMALADRATAAADQAANAMVGTPAQAEAWMFPGDKTCRWCKAKAQCPKLAAYVVEQTCADFDTIAAVPPPVPALYEGLSEAMIAVPLIEQWCGAVRSAVHNAVAEGQEVLGTDGLPMKFVEGKLGNRRWIDDAAAEAALVGQIADKAYAPRKIITAPQAAKILDKKKSAALWTDIFEPMIHKPPGKPQLALGSDERPTYTGAATGDEFEEIGNANE
jgi:hypothetical protein